MRVNTAIMAISFVVLLTAFWNRNEVPRGVDYRPELDSDPLQTRTSKRPFSARYNGIDYRVELGACLLCLGTKKNQKESVAEGMQVLRSVFELEPRFESDAIDLHFAGVLMESADQACNYSHDGFIDVEGMGKQL